MFVTFAGLMGMALLVRQNSLLKEQTQLLEKQNTKIDLQIVTAEAQRRADITSEIFNVLRRVDETARTSRSNKNSDGSANSTGYREIDVCALGVRVSEGCMRDYLVLPSEVLGQIRVVARIATPFYSVEPSRKPDDSWTFSAQAKALSRHRGTLLQGLLPYRPILKGIDFSETSGWGIPMQDSYFENVTFNGSDLSQASLIRSYFSQSDFSRANLTNAWLNGSVFEGCALADMNLSGAVLAYTNFSKSNLIYRADTDASDTMGERTEPRQGERYKIAITTLHLAKQLHGIILPDGWIVDKSKERKDASGNTIEWVIDTPWEDYRELVEQQKKVGYLDLSAHAKRNGRAFTNPPEKVDWKKLIQDPP